MVRAVGGEAFQDAVHLTLGHAVFLRKEGDRIGHLFPTPPHGGVFGIEVNVLAVACLHA